MDQLNPIVPPVEIIQPAPKEMVDKKIKIKKSVPKFLWIILIIFSVITVLFFFFIFVPGKKILAQIENIKKSLKLNATSTLLRQGYIKEISDILYLMIAKPSSSTKRNQ